MSEKRISIQDVEFIKDLNDKFHLKVRFESENEYINFLKHYKEMGKQTLLCGPSTEKELL